MVTRADRAGYQRRYDQRKRAEALAYLGGVCVRCGFDDVRALQIDHVNGGGRQERLRLKGSNSAIARRALAGEPGYQLLCANCNWIKRHESREHGGRPVILDA